MATSLDTAKLRAALETVHHAGMPGLFAEVRDGDQVWRHGCGVADLDTGDNVTPDMRHRVGSITKTFTAAAVLQQVDDGQIELDAPISRYLPDQLPRERGAAITVRMLLNHTSGLPEYLPRAFPSLGAFPALDRTTPQSLEDNRSKRFHPVELIELGVTAPATGAPGDTPGRYSNTNYLLLGQLLEQVTGTAAQRYITEHVITPAQLPDTMFPTDTHIVGPHSGHYESWFGMFDPPRDFSVYDMSWVWVAADLISTVTDLNRFFGLLLAGEIISPESLAEMQRTVPVISFEGTRISYGLGLHHQEIPGQGTYWGHDGSVWGGGALSMTRADGLRQLSIAHNLQRWNRFDESGKPGRHPIDDALAELYAAAYGETPAA